MYSYKIWGADIVSDVEIDISDSNVKMKLIEGKAAVDRTGNITVLFEIKNGVLNVFPDDVKSFNDYIVDEGLYSFKDFYYTKW
jgi:hypothetical protein